MSVKWLFSYNNNLMNNTLLAELDAMSGASQQSAQLIKLDEVRLNGKDGVFTIKYKTREKVKEGDREVYPKEEIKGTLKLLFLKKRRALIEYGKGGTVVRSTNEHNTTSDTVKLTHNEGGKSEVGVASALREKYPNLRTHEIIYAMNLETEETVRLIVRGSSLHMQEKVEGVTLFYDYLQSFTGDDKFYLYETEMTPKPVKTPLGTVYATHFARGRRITDEEFSVAASKIKELHLNTKAADATVQSSAPSAPKEEDLDTIDYGDTNVNVDDIPF